MTIVINLLNNRTYPVAIAAKDKTKGLLITPTWLLANNYTIDITITTTDAGVNTLYLNGNGIQKVEFVRMDKP